MRIETDLKISKETAKDFAMLIYDEKIKPFRWISGKVCVINLLFQAKYQLTFVNQVWNGTL
jgi:hypothetical protein